uniref:Reverse transcriptase domain-containing protein n=1 Tax=Tanacetum cinerariifolium TaxID=118510 RepID=A0A6L2K7U8_TANCI|nr:hypothetical protein [Tanacetum cinerariifolium]
MSSASSAVTYTSVYTDSEPGRVFWGADEELSDGEYVVESDPKEDPEEYEDDETEDGLVDYPMDGGDDGDDDYGDSFGDDADDEDEDEEDEEEEEEDYLAPADSAIVIPTDELPSPPEGTEPRQRGARLARCTAPATLPLPPLPPPLHMPPPVYRRDDIPETEMLPRKRLCLSTLGSRYEVGESFTARPIGGREIDYGFVGTLDAKARRRGIKEVGYGIRDTWVDPTDTVLEIAPMTMGEAQMVETLRVMGDMRREMGDMQAKLLAMREQPRRARHPGGYARVPNHQKAPRDADSNI